MTDYDKASFQKATHYHTCNKPLYNKEKREYDKVRDHCHITGKYRGAAHNSCNPHLRLGNGIPVVFHNLRGYDSHLIMQAISQVDGEITCISNNMEKYISFRVLDHYHNTTSKRLFGKPNLTQLPLDSSRRQRGPDGLSHPILAKVVCKLMK